MQLFLELLRSHDDRLQGSYFGSGRDEWQDPNDIVKAKLQDGRC